MAASERWGFDFVRGKPMEDTKLFLWERVPPTNDIPEMYTLSRAAHIRHIDADHQMRSPSKRRQYRTSSYIDLLDERSEQSNNHIAASNVLDLSFEDVDAGHSSASSCDEESFDERTAAVHYDKMLMDTTNENDLNCTSASSNSSILSNASQLESCQPTDVRLMALSMSTISAVPKSVPVTIASASVSVRRANNVNAPTASNISTTNAQSSRTSCRATNTVSRNLRSSPRNRETKRQPKITGKLAVFVLRVNSSLFCTTPTNVRDYIVWRINDDDRYKWIINCSERRQFPINLKFQPFSQFWKWKTGCFSPSPWLQYTRFEIRSLRSNAVSWKCN